METNNLFKEHKWKNSQYLYELQKLLDLTDNINEKNLKQLIINQILKYDECITKIVENLI